MNILVIAVDTMRADHLGCYGYHRETSPNIDALAEESILFENHITQTGHTMPIFTTWVTGQYPVTHDIVATLSGAPNEPDQVLNDRTATLAELFRAGGYTTVAFDNLLQFRCIPKWFAKGYDFYINTLDPKNPFVAAVLAEQINARLFNWLDCYCKDPFFMFVHYWDTHQPYNQPDPYRQIHIGGPEPKAKRNADGREYLPRWGWIDRLTTEKKDKIGLYDGEYSYVDHQIGRVINKLKEVGIYDDTFIVLTGDHGEDMEEHNSPFEHRETYEANTHVPLIVKPHANFEFTPGKRILPLTGHIDLMPTLLDLAGLPVQERVDGKSWLPLVRGETARIHSSLFIHGGVIKQFGRWRSAELGVRTETHKFVKRGMAVFELTHEARHMHELCMPPPENRMSLEARIDYFNGLPKTEIYNLTQDPCEVDNLMHSEGALAAALERDADAYASLNPERFIWAL